MNNETRHRQLTQFVQREVFYRVSHLVSELANKAEHFPQYEEDLCDAWHAPLTEDDYKEALESCGLDIGDCDTWQEACDMHDIDASEYRRDIFEHWIVSDWLANRLEEHGERVLRDFFGLTVWGRAGTGQAIALDYVIGAIYDELHREVAA